jgi:hypothetical protein
MVKTMADKNWSLVISPKRKLFDLQLRDLIRYRDLVFLFVSRDFAVQYKQTILGPLWYIINPLFSTVMYSFVFGNLANIGTDGIPFLLFYYSGTMLWTFFTGCFTNASELFITNANIFGKVYFPRLTVPNTMTIESLPLRQSSRNELLGSLLARCRMNVDADGSKQVYIMDKRGEGVPVILIESEKLSGIKPEYLLIDDTELRLTIFAAHLP